VTNEEINARLKEAARSLGFAHVAVANNDVSAALSNLAKVYWDISVVYQALACSPKLCNEQAGRQPESLQNYPLDPNR
jgi:hypothetical protein